MLTKKNLLKIKIRKIFDFKHRLTFVIIIYIKDYFQRDKGRKNYNRNLQLLMIKYFPYQKHYIK